MKLYKKAKTANEDFIDWFSDHIDSGYTGTLIDELSDIEFHSDLEARAGFQYFTGKQARDYNPFNPQTKETKALKSRMEVEKKYEMRRKEAAEQERVFEEGFKEYRLDRHMNELFLKLHKAGIHDE